MESFFFPAGSFPAAEDSAFATREGFTGGMTRQYRLVLLNTGSHTLRMEGMIKILTAAEISAPRASITQMVPIRSMLETKDTPSVAQKSTRALVIIEGSEVVAAM